jgi:ribokinase
MSFLTVFGHTNIDYLARVPRLPRPHQSMAFEAPVRALGGTAANVALAAGALRTPVILGSNVGLDFPAEYVKALRAQGVDLRFLRRVKGHQTPVCWIFSDPHERQMAFIHQGAEGVSDRLAVQAGAVRASRVVHFATGRPTHHIRAARLAKRLGKHVSFDPGQELAYVWSRASFLAMARLADTLFLNEPELRIAMGHCGARKPADLLRRFDEVVVTRGRRGAQRFSVDGTETVPAFKARGIANTTGAGDAFRGGFYAAQFRRLPPREQLRWGAAAASLAIEHEGGAQRFAGLGKLRQRLRQ